MSAETETESAGAGAGPDAPRPAGPLFPARAIASLLDITERRLQQLVAEGWIPREERGQYSLFASVRGYIRYLRQHQRDASRTSEHQRLARAQAVKVEMENLRRAGEVVLRDDVMELLQQLMAALVGAAEGIPGRTANEFAATDDAAYIRQRQQDEYRKLRNILADTLEKFAEYREDLADLGSAGETSEATDAEPMG